MASSGGEKNENNDGDNDDEDDSDDADDQDKKDVIAYIDEFISTRADRMKRTDAPPCASGDVRKYQGCRRRRTCMRTFTWENILECNGDLFDITRGVRGGVSVLLSVYHRRVRRYTFFLSSFLLL